MATKHTPLTRLRGSALTTGQLAWLRGEPDPPDDSVLSFNHHCWLRRSARSDDRTAVLPDRSPGSADLWNIYGEAAIAERKAKGITTPHPYIKTLGLPSPKQ